MNHTKMLLAALFNDRLDYTTTINALRLVLRKPLLEKVVGRAGQQEGDITQIKLPSNILKPNLWN